LLCSFVFESGFRFCVFVYESGCVVVYESGLGLLLLFLLLLRDVVIDSGQKIMLWGRWNFMCCEGLCVFWLQSIGEDEEEVLEKMKMQKVESDY
jgi:hypothetical protein